MSMREAYMAQKTFKQEISRAISIARDFHYERVRPTIFKEIREADNLDKVSDILASCRRKMN